MATEASRKRSANVGHHTFGTLVTLSDGTAAFLPATYLSESDGTAIATISDPDLGPALFTSNIPKGWAIAQGFIADHENFRGFGYDSAVKAGAWKDINGYSGLTIVPASAVAMEVVSSDAQDVGTVVTSGTATGGSTTTLIDTGKDFVALSVAVGDAVLNDTDVISGVVVTVDSTIQVTIRQMSESTFSGKAYRIVTSGGTGVGVMEHHGLDANFAEQSEFIVLNGTTVVAAALSSIRSNNFHVMYTGAPNREAAGNIDIQDTGGGQIYNRVPAGGNMTEQIHYTVPAGKVMYMTSWSGGSSGNKPARIQLRATVDFHDRSLLPGVFHYQDVVVSSGSDEAHQFRLPLRFPEQSDVKLSARSIGAGTTEVGGSFEFWIEPA